MKPTKNIIEKKLRNNAMDAIALRFALRDKLDVLDILRNEVSENPYLQDRYNLEDMDSLRGMLVRLVYKSLNRKNLRKTEEKIREMVHTISSTEEAWAPLCPWYYLSFLYSLRSLIADGFLYSLRNSVIYRKLRELSELAD